jgi:hypothetical protein
MDYTFVQTKTFRGILYGVGVAAVAFALFGVGNLVGYRRASFAYGWGESYHRNFGGPQGGFLQPPMGNEMPNPHGTFGRVVRVEPPMFIVAGDDGIEKSVAVTSGTSIRRLSDAIGIDDLVIGDYVVVVGQPNAQGQIEAGLVRVVPPPPYR